MAPMERDASRDADRPLRHQHSTSSDHGRALIPMWDSSDPERAPPPLPLNPQSPVTSRAGTSSAIQSAHAALTEKARESGLVHTALTKRGPEVSPERPLPLLKGSAHKRMQSLQPGTVRDLSLMIESGRDCSSPTPRSPEKSSTRPTTPHNHKLRDPFVADPRPEEREERGERGAMVLSPTPGPSLTPIIRPHPVRRSQHSILGENTPPQSATMLALQSMSTPQREAEAPLANITNGSNPNPVAKAPQALDNLSIQILSLTNIATSLQKEMSALSRRSRDNATDLLSLKEATNARDEDIRKSLRDLITNAQEVTKSSTRDHYGGNLLLDNKPHSPPMLSKAVRPFSLPRIPSPNSFATSLDRESLSTPSLYGAEAPATIALLEKIVREMGTKEGQDRLIGRLTEIVEKLSGMASAEKVEELLKYVKASQDQTVVLSNIGKSGGQRSRNYSFDEHEIDYDRSPMTSRVERLINDNEARRSSAPPSRAADIINDDILKIIRSVKDSVAQGGGLTAEVKALVRELRGEVLGMGREMGRRLDEVGSTKELKNEVASKAEVSRVVEQGLSEMKEHMNQLLKEHRRQSAASIASKPPIDYQEIYNAMRAAMQDNSSKDAANEELSREDVLQAVKEAWESYKPEIEVQQIGLERDEVLNCLQEGLREYAPQSEQPAGATREEVFMAVVEGLKHFVPPQVETPATLSRDEVLETVRECLEEFEFPVAPSAIGAEISKEDMVDAVKQGLDGFDFPQTASAIVPRAAMNDDEIVVRLQDIMDFMREEFKAVSDEAKQNVAANGRDTEQVLDATKDGFEKLRADIENYVDRASGASNQEEFMEGLIRTLDVFREEIAGLVSNASDGSKEMLKGELEALRDTVNTSMVPATPPVVAGGNNREVLEALHDGLSSLKTELNNRPIAGTNEVLDALQEGFEDLRGSLERLGNKPVDLTANDEILDALKSGLDGVRTDIDGLREQSRAVATLEDTSAAVVPAPVDMLKQDDIKNLEALMAQLQVKVESIEMPLPVPPPAPQADPVSKETLEAMEEMLRNLQESVAGMSNRERAPTDAAAKEDVEAIETILRNTKARLDDLMDGEQSVRKDHVDILETLLLETKEGLGQLSTRVEGLSSREDINMVESLVAQVANGFEEMKERHDKQFEDPEKATKTDIEAIGGICQDVKTAVEQLAAAELANLPSKEDLQSLETLVREFREQSETHAETNVKAFEERQAETVGVSERVTEVKMFLEELQGTITEKLSEGASGIDSVHKLLETLSEGMANNANVGIDLKEMFDTMKSEFEEAKAGVVGAKLDTDEKFVQTTDTLGTKIDERINELMTKYEEFQLVMDDRAKAGEERDTEMEAAMLGTKAVADELKTLIDTLGSTVTDSLEKMEEASKTVFERVEDLVTKSEENHSDGKAEHQLTRDQVLEVMGVVEGTQGHVVEYQPKILESIKDVLLIVGQHYEHSKSSITTIQEKIEEAKPPEQQLLPPVEKYDDTGVQEKLDKLVAHSEETAVHEKLDKLVDHTHAAGKAFSQLDTLDKIHQQVLQTAAEVADFLTSQKQLKAEEHEDHQKTLQETNIALERGLAQTVEVETNLASLREEEERLKQSVLGLRGEQEGLTRQKIRLSADVSSLETALRLRREELHDMETRAEGLERRILEGVMDHSRVLLMAKANQGRDFMSRKRVPSQKPANNALSANDTAPVTSKPRAAFNMTMSSKRNLQAPSQSPAGRRILSLSQINHNVPAGGFKRSQSVRAAAGAVAMRKASWAPAGAGRVSTGGGGKGYGDLGGGDKENAGPPLDEGDEDEYPEDGDYAPTPRQDDIVVLADKKDGSEEDLIDEDGDGDDRSETETLRRSSLGTTVVTGYMGTESEFSTDADYSDRDETASEWTESMVGSSLVSGGGEGNEVALYQG